MDSTKLLTEKLAMARELSNLKPEIDHLRSQASSHKSLLAEKLSLQRQLENLRAEFEEEKQSTKRTLPQESIFATKDKRLENQVQELKTELKKERLEKQKLGRELQRVTGNSEAQKLALQSQLDVLKDKLKSARAQLKKSQARVKSDEVSQEKVPHKPTRSNAVAAKSRKREAVQMESDAVIGTPGLGPETKRRKRASTLPGDKSTFSITPYLNRTASVPPESSPRQVESSDVEGEELLSRVHDIPKGELIASKRGQATHATIEEANQTGEWPGALENAKANKNDRKRLSTREKSSIGPVLQTVAEEEDDTSHDTSSRAPTHLQKDHKTDTKNGFRKLQGSGAAKTLFDDEGLFAPSFTNGGRIIAKPRMLLGKSSSTASFGAISPLKRDKSRSILDVSIAR
ncbi:MAG: hypothetical protein Q9214_005014 [Letrouitia sp. 1 TL-2023]